MTIRSIVATVATAAVLAVPLALAAPANAQLPQESIGSTRAKPAPKPCVRITAPGSHTVTVGESRHVRVRLSKACIGSKVSFDGMPAYRVGIRHLVVSTARYIPGKYKLTVRVNPTKGEGKTVRKTFTYKVVA